MSSLRLIFLTWLFIVVPGLASFRLCFCFYLQLPDCLRLLLFLLGESVNELPLIVFVSARTLTVVLVVLDIRYSI